MQFLIDEDLPRSTGNLLRRYGHEAIDVRDIGLRGAKDSQIASLSGCTVYTLVYSFYGHWVWSEGWLAKLQLGVGVKDFAGSGVVHATGFVAISGPCAYVAPWAAVIIGIIGGLLMCGSTWLVEHKFKVDDPLGAVSVHAANGLWGLLAVGIFADGSYGGVSGLITGSGQQFLAQVIAFLTVIVWAGGLGFAIFFGLKHTIGIRVSRTEELDGLDVNIHGSKCYPPEGKYLEDIDDVIRKHIGLGELVR